MSFRKYQSVEKSEVVSPEEQTKLAANLKKVGKTSAAELTEEERAKVRPLDV